MPFGARGGNETIMYVEDDELVRALNIRILQQLGYSILEAESSAVALDIVISCKGTIDLLISDVAIDDINGPELVKRVREVLPEIKVLFTSGYAEESIIQDDAPMNTVHFLAKPFRPKQLADAIREILEA